MSGKWQLVGCLFMQLDVGIVNEGELKRGEYNRFYRQLGKFVYHPRGSFLIHKSFSKCQDVISQRAVSLRAAGGS